MTSVLELAAAWLAASVLLCLVLANAIGRAERRSSVERILVARPAPATPAPVAVLHEGPAAPPRPRESTLVTASWVTSTSRPAAARPSIEAGAVDAR